jgi:tetratricopeptide (TPR) repeat protein
MSSQPENVQTALENVTAGGDINATISQEIHHEPSKLADKIGVVPQSGSIVNIGTLIVGDRPNDLRSEKFTHDKDFYNNLGDREIDRNGNFVGREADLEQLHELLQSQSEQVGHLPTVLIVGMAGMGKSELVRQYGKLHLNDYAGGVGIFDGLQFGEELRDFIQLRFSEDRDLRYERNLELQVAEGWQKWQKICGAERSALIIIDDVTNYHDQVAPYLPKISGDRCSFRFVLTSRSRLRGNLAVHEIEELKTEAAVQVLTKWAEPNQQTVLDHPELAGSLCDRLGGLPLALTLVGNWLKITQDDLPKAIAKLEQEGLASEVLEPVAEAPENIDVGKNIKQGLKAVMTVSWQQLSPDAQQLGRVLSLFEPINLPWELVESVVRSYPQQSAAPIARKIWWQRFWDSLGQLVRGLFPFLGKPAEPTPPAFVPIRNLTKAEIDLRTRTLIQGAEEGKTYRLHRLIHEFFAMQWDEFDREGWQDAWLRGLSDRANEIPAFAAWDLVTAWQPLRSHFAAAQKFVEDRLKSTTNPALVSVYKLQNNNLIGGSFRLNQAPIFEATYRQAQSTHDRAKAALAKGESGAASYFDEAVKGYQKAIEQARVALPENSMILAGYLHQIARLFYELGNYSAGIPPAEESVQIANIKKASPLTLANYLDRLGFLYYHQGKYSEAEPLYVRLLSIWEHQLGEDHPDVAYSLNNLAQLYKSQGKYSEAEHLFMRSLSISKCQLGEEHPYIVSSLHNLAELYNDQGKYSEAEPLYVRLLSIRERQLGEDHPDVAYSLSGLAVLYKLQGKYSEAEPLFVRSLSIRERQLGEDHPDVATSLNNLAEFYYSQEKYSEAEHLHVRSLEIRERKLGEDHPDVATSLNNLAALYYSQGKYSEAESLFVRSLSIRKRQLGEDHPDVANSLNNLAELYKSQRKYSEAEPLFVRSLSIRERQLGKDHPDVANSLNNLAGLYYSQGKYSEAEPLYRRSLEIRERQLEADHPNVAESLNNLAGLYESQGKYSEAEPLYLRAIQILEKALGSEHPNTVTARQNYEIMCKTMKET